jgi:hypothetical protein
MRGATSVLVSDHRDDDNNYRLAVPTQMVMLPQEPHTVSMLLAHHPREWMRRRDDLGDVLDARARIQLYGHRHIFRPRAEAGNLIVHAGATHPERGNDWWPHYNVLRLETVADTGIALRAHVYPRRWHPRDMRFGVDADPDGVDHRTFDLPLGDGVASAPAAAPSVTLSPGTESRPGTVATPPPPTSPMQVTGEAAHKDTPAMESAPAASVTGHAQIARSYRDPKSSTSPVDSSGPERRRYLTADGDVPPAATPNPHQWRLDALAQAFDRIAPAIFRDPRISTEALSAASTTLLSIAPLVEALTAAARRETRPQARYELQQLEGRLRRHYVAVSQKLAALNEVGSERVAEPLCRNLATERAALITAGTQAILRVT